MHRNQWIKSWSKTQNLIALSSAKSELHASVKATTETLGAQSMAKGFHKHRRVKMLADASAVLGITSRRGIGKVRHLDANHMWIQEIAAKKKAEFHKVLGTTNPADMMTKEISQGDTEKHTEIINVCFPQGRAQGTSKVATDEIHDANDDAEMKMADRESQLQLVSTR